MESEGNELYQWRMCPAPGTGEAPVTAKQNRSSSVHFHSKNRQAERPAGYSWCSYILSLFPSKHPLHESDILFTE